MGEQTRRAVARLAAAGRDTASFAEELCGILQRDVPHRAACVVTVDPLTHLLTGTYKFGALAGRHELDHEWARLEYSAGDPTTMVELASRPVPAAAVSHLPGGTADSPRAAQLLAPAGYGDELRLVARRGGLPWGGVNLFRGADEDPFTRDEVALVAELAEEVADGLRAGLLRAASPVEGPPVADGPAVILVDPGGQVRTMSPAARDLLRAATDDAHRSPADSFVHGLVATARQRAVTGDPVAPHVRVRLPDGRWLICRAGVLHPADDATPDGDVVITVEVARPPEVVPLLVAAFGLTSREREVAELVARGLATKGIARALDVSNYTVQDHLKAVFAKVGVRSRSELVARLYNESYAALA